MIFFLKHTGELRIISLAEGKKHTEHSTNRDLTKHSRTRTY
jgi:hypothetical protein